MLRNHGADVGVCKSSIAAVLRLSRQGSVSRFVDAGGCEGKSQPAAWMLPCWLSGIAFPIPGEEVMQSTYITQYIFMPDFLTWQSCWLCYALTVPRAP